MPWTLSTPDPTLASIAPWSRDGPLLAVADGVEELLDSISFSSPSVACRSDSRRLDVISARTYGAGRSRPIARVVPARYRRCRGSPPPEWLSSISDHETLNSTSRTVRSVSRCQYSLVRSRRGRLEGGVARNLQPCAVRWANVGHEIEATSSAMSIPSRDLQSKLVLTSRSFGPGTMPRVTSSWTSHALRVELSGWDASSGASTARQVSEVDIAGWQVVEAAKEQLA